ncbi:hypothetical protein JZO77_15470 [Enterococcus hulanensis]|uniref:hypothetical protein n=1 Tax=Enterococcus hulanensis TaxID=2559929 RepID=UPI001A8C2485|nr:hypothetical protein [Enterococcus hulanensis]MBO0458135.1 hypothetical protein [Enterococcus hulanensis]
MANATDLDGQLIQNLEDSGLKSKAIAQFIEAYQNGNTHGQKNLLVKQKCQLMEQLHIKQKQIDSLDYLIFRLKL